MGEVRVRFAPSPTGPLHIGGARSALFNWLFARRHGGTMIVRMEDTDLNRSAEEYEAMILEALRWLGLDWDEGIGVGGPHAPYRQRERLDIYRPYIDRLLNEGKAYLCFCSEEELEAGRQELSARGELPRYLGKCRNLTAAACREKQAAGYRAAVRFRVPEGQLVVVNDLVRGRVEFESDGIGDFIIVKSDGIPTYNFAVVLDDAEMNVTHIIRGEEHLSNTPRQLLIYRALGFTVPQFAHISLILGEDRSKMSKRHGAVSVAQYRRLGYLPEALVNFLALLGWSPEGEREIFSVQELVQQFSLERVSKSPAVFNFDKLKWMNSHYLRQLPASELSALCLPHLAEAGLVEAEPSPQRLAWVERVVATAREHLEYAAQIPGLVQDFFGEEVTLDPQDTDAAEALRFETSPAVIARFREKALEFNEWDEETARETLKEVGKELGVKGKPLFMTVRVALTGKSHGRDLNTLLALLGPQLVARRLQHTLLLLQGLTG